MIRLISLSFTFVMLVCVGNANAQSDDLQLKGDLQTGSNIKKVIAQSSGVPFDKSYSEMTPEQKQMLKSAYEKMGPDDEPPYPLHGIKTLVESIIKASGKLRDTGSLVFLVNVSSKGDAQAISVIDSTSPEMTQFVSQVLFLTKYKPALCAGVPCDQQYMFRFRLVKSLSFPVPETKEKYSLEFKKEIALADQGDHEAQQQIGWMYYTGKDTPQDYEQAMKWTKLSADSVNAIGQYHLGLLFSQGHGTAEDNSAAAKWYRLSADQGNADAQYALGRMFENGKGVTQDYSAATKLFRLSAASGNKDAKKRLAEMGNEMHDDLIGEKNPDIEAVR